MWLKLHAQVTEGKTAPILTNMDNVLHVIPRDDGGAAIFGVDGSMYPVAETCEQIDKAMMAFANGRKHA